jgi:hypothetical protein
MDHRTAVLLLINALQSDQTPEDIQKELDTLLQTVDSEDRDAVLKEAREKYERLEAGLPFDTGAA